MSTSGVLLRLASRISAWLCELTALTLFTVFANISHAQTDFRCAALLPSTSTSPPYKRVAKEARCEGYFDQTVSQPFVELLSLTRHSPDLLPATAEKSIQIRSQSKEVTRLVIQPLQPSPFYRVDAALPADGALNWNTTTMLQTTGLRLSDIGFLAHVAVGDSDIASIVPVSLPPAVADESLAYAVLRVSVPVTSIAARQYRLGAAATVNSDWQSLLGVPLYAWDTIVLPIGIATDGLDTRVDVRAVDTKGLPLPLLQFVVVGR